MAQLVKRPVEAVEYQQHIWSLDVVDRRTQLSLSPKPSSLRSEDLGGEVYKLHALRGTGHLSMTTELLRELGNIDI